MSWKVILALLAFFVLTAAGSYWVVNKRPGKLVDVTSPTTVGKRAVVSKEDENAYVLLGRFTDTLRVNESGYLEGAFILEGDPNQTKLRTLFTPNEEGVFRVARYQRDFTGVPEVQQLTSEAVLALIKQDTPALIRIVFLTSRPLKNFESFLKRNYDILASGSWAMERPESIIIITSTFGLIY